MSELEHITARPEYRGRKDTIECIISMRELGYTEFGDLNNYD